MRIDAWAGLVTDASPFASSVPAGAASVLINLRPRLGVLESRRGMQRVGFADTQERADLLDCCSVTLDGAPAILALRADGSLLALRSPNYARPTALLPALPSCPQPGELWIDYAQNVAGASEVEIVGPCLPPTPEPPSRPGDPGSLGFAIEGGTSDGSYYPYEVDALAACPTLPEIDGGNAAYTGLTGVTEADLCTNDDPPPPLPGATPSAPASLAVAFGAASASLTWQPPSSDGGQPVTGYDVQLSLDGILWLSQPGAPSGPTVSFGNQSAALSWNAPADTGNAAISGYEIAVEASTNGGTTWTSVNP